MRPLEICTGSFSITSLDRFGEARGALKTRPRAGPVLAMERHQRLRDLQVRRAVRSGDRGMRTALARDPVTSSSAGSGAGPPGLRETWASPSPISRRRSEPWAGIWNLSPAWAKPTGPRGSRRRPPDPSRATGPLEDPLRIALPSRIVHLGLGEEEDVLSRSGARFEERTPMFTFACTTDTIFGLFREEPVRRNPSADLSRREAAERGAAGNALIRTSIAISRPCRESSLASLMPSASRWRPAGCGEPAFIFDEPRLIFRCRIARRGRA